MILSVDLAFQLKNFSLHVTMNEENDRIGILGASGCGKSMTLKSLAGILTPDSGRIVLGERVLFDSDRKINVKPQKRKVGYLFQNYALFPTMTVRQNIAAGVPKNRTQREDHIESMIFRFRLSGLEDRYPGQLSGGQQQRVALARLMAQEPDMILLDEPFSAMDSYLRDELQREVADMLASYEGKVILVTHNRDEVYRFCQKTYVMSRGAVIRHGTTADVFRNPENPETARLSGCKNYTRLERIDDHHGYLTDWGITITTARSIPEGTCSLGYRAHNFIPVWKQEITDGLSWQESGRIPFTVTSQVFMPFERNYYLKPQGIRQPGNPEVITWLVQENLWEELDQKGLPDYLALEERHMLFLK